MQHLAIMKPGYIDYILSGKKTIETRFTRIKMSPFNKICVGDIVYLKETGKEVSACFTVKNVIYYDNISQEDEKNIKEKYEPFFQMNNKPWRLKEGVKYGTLIFIDNPRALQETIRVKYFGQKGFLSFDNIESIKIR